VVGGGGEQKDERDRRGQEGAVVDVTLDCVQVGERAGEADGEQEAEQDLGPGDEGAKFLEQLAVFALESFFDRFVLGSFPESLLDHVVGGHGCPSTRGLSGSTLSLDLPCEVCCVVGGVGATGPPVDRPHDIPRW
jgi:hypothetical protein